MSTLMTSKEITQELKVSRAAIYAMISRGEFPAPIKTGKRSSGWLTSEVMAWLESRPRGVGPAPGKAVAVGANGQEGGL